MPVHVIDRARLDETLVELERAGEHVERTEFDGDTVRLYTVERLETR